MFLADLIEVPPAVRSSTKLKKLETSVEAHVAEAKSVLNYLGNIGALNNDLRNQIASAGTERITKDIKNTLPNGILDWPANTDLVSSLTMDYRELNTRSMFTRLKSCPRGKMPQIRELAESLGLIIIPYEYGCKQRIENDRFPNQTYSHTGPLGLANNFKNDCTDNKMTAWMIAPVQYYSIQNNVANMKYDFFVPTSAQQAFLALKLVMPLLISTMHQIETLSKTVSNHGIDIQNLRRTVESQQKQIEGIQNQLTIERQKRIDNELKLKEIQRKQEEAEAALVRFMMFDPMMIAVPDSVTDINSYEGNVVLGPCWGPEVEPMVAELLGLDSHKKYAKHESSMRELFKRQSY